MVAFPTTQAAQATDKDAACVYLSCLIDGKQFNLVSSHNTPTDNLPDEVQCQLAAVALVECAGCGSSIARKAKTLDTITVDEVPYETHSTILLTVLESIKLMHEKYPDAKWFKCWAIYRGFAVITPQYNKQPDLSHATRFTK